MAGSAPATLHKILAWRALLRQLFIKFWLGGLCSGNSSREGICSSFDLLISRCDDGSVVQLGIVARSYDEKLMIFFDTHFKSNSSSIGNVEDLLGIEPAYADEFVGH
jgi:hypothetical protein